jgi:hypothetical protein
MKAYYGSLIPKDFAYAKYCEMEVSRFPTNPDTIYHWTYHTVDRVNTTGYVIIAIWKIKAK